MYQWQYHHIVNELAHHDVVIDVLNPLAFENYDLANEACINQLTKGGYDALMTVHGANVLYTDTIVKAKSLGLARILINFDNLLAPREHLDFSKHFDVLMLLNVDNNPIYKKYKCPYVFAPYAANPYYFKDLRNTNQNGICFIGTPYGTRCRPINTLTNANVSFDLYASNASVSKAKKLGSGLHLSDKIRATIKMGMTKPGRKVLHGAFKYMLGK